MITKSSKINYEGTKITKINHEDTKITKTPGWVAAAQGFSPVARPSLERAFGESL